MGSRMNDERIYYTLNTGIVSLMHVKLDINLLPVILGFLAFLRVLPVFLRILKELFQTNF